ncbi:Modification methylase ScrFIA [Durusdinium trenchii]|uniref:Modification methylase ScrFIA n=1 Tax=Durusdinium trenchii TaxID=1381693 RepID=A0ABP0IZL9_9DINO
MKLSISSSRSAADVCGPPRHALFGRTICQRAFKKLLGLGSTRYTKLRRAALSNLCAPIDGRTLPRQFLLKTKTDSLRKRALVTEFLEWLYNAVSEPIPEAKGDLVNKRKAHDEEQEPASAVMKFRRFRGRRPKLARIVNRACKDPSRLRMLPPGSYTDYLNMLRARHPPERISLKLFSACGVCTRHKLIISKLGNDRAARDSQMREFVAHLQRQYRDRTHYWAAQLHPPQQFVTTLEGWLQDKSVREHDPLRSVMKVDQVRDWSHGKKSQDPYDMIAAADHLEKLASGDFERGPLLDVSRSDLDLLGLWEETIAKFLRWQEDTFMRVPDLSDVLQQLSELIALDGMKTNSNDIGVWEKASSIAEAYKIGRSESTAAHNLLNNVDPAIVSWLTSLVQRWTLNKFLTHDAIAQGAFNRETCTATSCMTAWQAQLLNTLEVVELLCNRMDSDFSSTGLKFRKPYTFNQVESSLHLYSSDSYRLKSCISMTCEPVAW